MNCGSDLSLSAETRSGALSAAPGAVVTIPEPSPTVPLVAAKGPSEPPPSSPFSEAPSRTLIDTAVAADHPLLADAAIGMEIALPFSDNDPLADDPFDHDEPTIQVRPEATLVSEAPGGGIAPWDRPSPPVEEIQQVARPISVGSGRPIPSPSPAVKPVAPVIPRNEPPSEPRIRTEPPPMVALGQPPRSASPFPEKRASLGAQLSESLRPRRQSPVPSRTPFPRQIREEKLSPSRPDPREDPASTHLRTSSNPFLVAAGVARNSPSEPRVGVARPVPAARAPGARSNVPFEALSLEEQMEQAKHFVCRSCSTPVPLVHKFCGRCGAVVPPEIVGARTKFFGALQTPGRAKIILIRGEGVEGLSYQLNAEQHIVGRTGQLVFPDDPFVSPRHANLFYRDAQLVVRDEGSVNGVYVRVRGTVDVEPGDLFLAGEQLFRVEPAPATTDTPGPDGTYFYSSPKHHMAFRVTQILQGGLPGIGVCARGSALQVGREGGDLNFPADLYMSASHCKVEDVAGKLTLTDLNSRNGTYVKIKGEQALSHGDYLFIGKKLLRVEVTN
jgi:pSer/pThr/pTyr-binding forkhead associated (FHA) protein